MGSRRSTFLLFSVVRSVKVLSFSFCRGARGVKFIWVLMFCESCLLELRLPRESLFSLAFLRMLLTLKPAAETLLSSALKEPLKLIYFYFFYCSWLSLL